MLEFLEFLAFGRRLLLKEDYLTVGDQPGIEKNGRELPVWLELSS